MDSATWAAVIGTILGSGLLTAVANNMWQRSRNKAEVTEKLTAVALSMVDPLKGELDELRGEVRVLRQQNGILARQQREQSLALAAHSAWDVSAQAALMTHGVEMPPMPPLAVGFHIRGERTRAEDFALPDTQKEDRP